jgi:hypothetical protein
MRFSKFDQTLSGDYVHAGNLSQNEIDVNKNIAIKVMEKVTNQGRPLINRKHNNQRLSPINPLKPSNVE